MVSSIVPGSSSATAFGVDPRFARAQSAADVSKATNGAARFDSVDIGSAASWGAARDSIVQGLSQISSALRLGEEAQQFLLKIQEIARGQSEAPDAAETELRDALDGFARRVETAISQGVSVVSGQPINVQAEPGATTLTIEGFDLRLNENAGEIFKFSRSAAFGADPAALAVAAQRSTEALQGAVTRLGEAGRALEAHAGFVSAAADVATGVRGDLDADGARLLALQVRQGLESLGGGAAIANVEPQAVLALFKA